MKRDDSEVSSQSLHVDDLDTQVDMEPVLPLAADFVVEDERPTERPPRPDSARAQTDSLTVAREPGLEEAVRGVC